MKKESFIIKAHLLYLRLLELSLLTIKLQAKKYYWPLFDMILRPRLKYMTCVCHQKQLWLDSIYRLDVLDHYHGLLDPIVTNRHLLAISR